MNRERAEAIARYEIGRLRTNFSLSGKYLSDTFIDGMVAETADKMMADPDHVNWEREKPGQYQREGI